MPSLVGKQRHTSVITNPGLSSRTEPVLETRYPMCKGNTYTLTLCYKLPI